MPETWTVKLTDPVQISCAFQPTCVFHKDSHLAIKAMNPILFPIYSGGHITRAYAIDITMSCPECAYTEVFGVALSEEEMDAISKSSKKGSA